MPAGGVEALANESAQTTINVQQPCLCLKFKPGHFNYTNVGSDSITVPKCKFDYSSEDDFKRKFMNRNCPTSRDSWVDSGVSGRACDYFVTYEIVTENNEFFVQPKGIINCWRWEDTH